MSNKTTNYSLVKPLDNEYYNIGIPNDNMDIIDAELKKGQNHRENISNPHGVTAADVGASNPNLLINGDYRINQRGKLATAYSMPNTYTLDRWILWYDDYGTSNIWVEQQRENNEYNAKIHFNTLNSVTGFLFKQTLEDNVEGLSILGGKTVTFSVRSYSTNSNMGIFIKYLPFGSTEYTKAITAIPQGVGGHLRYSVTCTIPKNASSISCGVLNTATLISSDCGYMNLFNAKLEVGSVPTPFVPRPIAEELAMCKRYYQRVNNNLSRWNYFGIIDSTGTTTVRFMMPISVPLRVDPSVSLKGSIYTGGAKITALSMDQLSDIQVKLIATLSSAIATGLFLASGNGTDASDILLDAEIY